MAYAIKNKQTKEFFAGFDSNDKALWTADEWKAWNDDWIVKAELQARLLFSTNKMIQKRPVKI